MPRSIREYLIEQIESYFNKVHPHPDFYKNMPIAAPEKPYMVVASNRHEFVEWCRDKRIDPYDKLTVRYAIKRRDLVGLMSEDYILIIILPLVRMDSGVLEELGWNWGCDSCKREAIRRKNDTVERNLIAPPSFWISRDDHDNL